MTIYVEYYYKGDLETLKNNGYNVRKHCKKTNEFMVYKYKEQTKKGIKWEYIITINRVYFENELQNDAIDVFKYDIKQEQYAEAHVLPHIKDLMRLGLIERKEYSI